MEPGTPSDDMFAAPSTCHGVAALEAHARPGFALRMLHSLPLPPSALLQGVQCMSTAVYPHHLVTDDEYGAFAAAHGRVHATVGEHAMRAALYAKNKAFIEAWNEGVRADAATAAVNGAAPPVNYTMAVNRFADWTEARRPHAARCTLHTARCLAGGVQGAAAAEGPAAALHSPSAARPAAPL